MHAKHKMALFIYASMLELSTDMDEVLFPFIGNIFWISNNDREVPNSPLGNFFDYTTVLDSIPQYTNVTGVYTRDAALVSYTLVGECRS